METNEDSSSLIYNPNLTGMCNCCKIVKKNIKVHRSSGTKRCYICFECAKEYINDRCIILLDNYQSRLFFNKYDGTREIEFLTNVDEDEWKLFLHEKFKDIYEEKYENMHMKKN